MFVLRRMKTVWSLFLIFGLVLGFFPVFAVETGAETLVVYPVEGGNIYLDGDWGIVIGADKSITSADIPEEVNGVKVTEIFHHAFEGCTALSKVNIPNGVTTIGGNAFSDCSSLVNVNIPEGVTTIRLATFVGCTSLSEIKLPDSLTTIGSCAFQGCDSLSEIKIPDSVTTIEAAFEDCHGLKRITIPASVTDLKDFVFMHCTSLTEVTIFGDIKKIKPFTFAHCPSLASITIPKSITKIEGYAFYNCPALSEVAYEGSDEEWNQIQISEENDALKNAKRGRTVKANSLIFDIYSGEIVGCDRSVTEINIPAEIRGVKVISIRNSAFENCSSLTAVTFPGSVTSIGDSAFAGCTSLSSVTLPDGVTSIGNSVFSHCSALKNVTLPGRLTSIGDSAFRGCGSLGDIRIPGGVRTIGSSAFAGCASLSSVTLPDRITAIHENAFSECASLMKAEYSGTDEDWNKVSVGSGNDFLKRAKNGNLVRHQSLLFDISAREIIDCDRSETEIQIPETIAGVPVEAIGESVFSGFSSLTGLTLPDSVTEIKKSAFQDCSLLKNMIFPDGLTTIRQSVFSGCSSLVSVTVPKSIEAVENGAFAGCSSLSEVIYAGTEKQWASITVGEENAELLRATLTAAIPFGDLSGDSEINLGDWTLMIQYLLKRPVTINERNADINGDGKVDSADGAFLARYLEGWDVLFFN